MNFQSNLVDEMKKIEKSHNYIKKRHKYEKSESILRK